SVSRCRMTVNRQASLTGNSSAVKSLSPEPCSISVMLLFHPKPVQTSTTKGRWLMNKSLFDLSGKVALITGGNGGIGLGFAMGSAKQGGDICIWGRNESKNQQAVELLKPFGTQVHAIACDVVEEAVVE